MKRTTAIAAAVLLAQLATAQAAEGWRYGVSADVMHDDNATRGLYDADQKGDTVLTAEGSAVRSFMLGERSGALLRGSASYSHFTTFDDLSHVALQGRAAWRTQPGRGFGSPIFEIAGSLKWLQHADSDLRDGTIATLEGSVGSHVTDRVRLGAGLALDSRSGGDTGRAGEVAIYDLDNTRLWASLDYRLGVRNMLYSRLSLIEGDQVFNSVTVGGLTGAWATDTAFAAELGRATDSYRVDSSTTVFDIGVNVPLAREHNLDFMYTRYSSEAKEGTQNGNKYSGSIFRATYLYRFQ